MQKVPQKATPAKALTARTVASLVLSGYRVCYQGKIVNARITHIDGRPVVRKGA